MRLREPIKSKDEIGGPTDLQEVEDEIWKPTSSIRSTFAESQRLVELVLKNTKLLQGADKKANMRQRGKRSSKRLPTLSIARQQN